MLKVHDCDHDARGFLRDAEAFLCCEQKALSIILDNPCESEAVEDCTSKFVDVRLAGLVLRGAGLELPFAVVMRFGALKAKHEGDADRAMNRWD